MVIFMTFILFYACKKDSPDVFQDKSGRLSFHFSHFVNSDTLNLGSTFYQNAAGNSYQVSEVKYFISDVVLYQGGRENRLWYERAHFVDLSLNETLEWRLNDNVWPGRYDSIHFIFGLAPPLNVSHYFANPPEINQFWPDVLGGGYHFLMINGKYIDSTCNLIPYNLHVGRGQVYAGTTTNVDSIVGFVDNSFVVSLHEFPFDILPGKTTVLDLGMDINHWFWGYQNYNFNQWGPAIMQNQNAMDLLIHNGQYVFSIRGSHL